MTARQLHRIDSWVFGSDRSPGNLAVVIELDRVEADSAAMQAIARANAAPVTVFVHRTTTHAWARFFTPHRELELCGHGSLGAAAHLLSDGPGSIVLDASAQRLTVRRVDDLFVLEGAQGALSELREPAALSAALGLVPSELAAPPVVASIGSRKAIVELGSVERLETIAPDRAQLLEWGKRTQTNGCYLVVRLAAGRYRARSFNPSTGSDEDAATGVAAGALVATLPDLATNAWIEIQQGPRVPQLCTLFARRTERAAIEVAGRARIEQRAYPRARRAGRKRRSD